LNIDDRNWRLTGRGGKKSTRLKKEEESLLPREPGREEEEGGVQRFSFLGGGCF